MYASDGTRQLCPIWSTLSDCRQFSSLLLKWRENVDDYSNTQRAASPYVCCCVGLHLLERRLIQRAALGDTARCVFVFCTLRFLPFLRLYIYASYTCFAYLLLLSFADTRTVCPYCLRMRVHIYKNSAMHQSMHRTSLFRLYFKPYSCT